jgi:hypothetical protein
MSPCANHLRTFSFPPEMPWRGTHKPLHCHFDTGMYEWRKYMLWAPWNLQKPHFSTVSAHGHVANEQRLLRSKVLLLVRLSMICNKYGYKLGYVVCPVSICPLVFILPVFALFLQPLVLLLHEAPISFSVCSLSTYNVCLPTDSPLHLSVTFPAPPPPPPLPPAAATQRSLRPSAVELVNFMMVSDE